MNCITANGTLQSDNKCNQIDKPETVRDCFNSRCVPQWKIEEWSEVSTKIFCLKSMRKHVGGAEGESLFLFLC